MKKNPPIALIAVLLVSTAVFFGLWRQLKNDRSDLRLLAQTSASDSLKMFEEYQKTGEESS